MTDRRERGKPQPPNENLPNSLLQLAGKLLGKSHHDQHHELSANQPASAPYLRQLDMNSGLFPHSIAQQVEEGLRFPDAPQFQGVLLLRDLGIDGTGMRIAVIDPTIEYQIPPSPFLYGTDNPRAKVHGFGIAGVIQAALPRAQVRLYEVPERADVPDPESIIAQIQAATNQGMQVINLSMEKPQGSTNYNVRLLQAIQQAQAQGIIVVAATSYEYHKPGITYEDIPGVIMVSGLQKSGQPVERTPGARVDIYGPGEGVVYPLGRVDVSIQGKSHSFAAPFITIAAAVLHSRIADANQVAQILLRSTRDVHGYPLIDWQQIAQVF